MALIRRVFRRQPDRVVPELSCAQAAVPNARKVARRSWTRSNSLTNAPPRPMTDEQAGRPNFRLGHIPSASDIARDIATRSAIKMAREEDERLSGILGDEVEESVSPRRRAAAVAAAERLSKGAEQRRTSPLTIAPLPASRQQSKGAQALPPVIAPRGAIHEGTGGVAGHRPPATDRMQDPGGAALPLGSLGRVPLGPPPPAPSPPPPVPSPPGGDASELGTALSSIIRPRPLVPRVAPLLRPEAMSRHGTPLRPTTALPIPSEPLRPTTALPIPSEPPRPTTAFPIPSVRESPPQPANRSTKKTRALSGYGIYIYIYILHIHIQCHV